MSDQLDSRGLQDVKALRIEGAQRRAFDDVAIAETPAALVYNGTVHAVMMVTPVDLNDFALGFALTEGVVASTAEFELVDCVHGEHGWSLQAAIPQHRFEALGERQRNVSGRSGCGLCGIASLEAAVPPIRKLTPGATIAATFIAQGMRDLTAQQPLNRATAGAHAAAYVSATGLLVREDVGRHNALDKLVGAMAGAERPPGFLAMTSRASYEIVHKAAMVGIDTIAAISAPTDLAIRLADDAGITLIAFAREAGMSVYTHADRVT